MEIKEKHLRKFSIIVIIFSLMILIYLDKAVELPITSLDDISIENIDKNVKVIGKIQNQALINENLFFNIRNNQTSIRGTIFGITNEIEPNTFFLIQGRVSMYNQELQIIVSKIEEFKH